MDQPEIRLYRRVGRSVQPACAAAAAATGMNMLAAGRARARRSALFLHAGREHRQLFDQLGGLAGRARGALPVGGTDQDFAVLAAIVAVEFVEWHGAILPETG